MGYRFGHHILRFVRLRSRLLVPRELRRDVPPRPAVSRRVPPKRGLSRRSGEAAKADTWIRRNPDPGLRTQCLNEMTDLIVDVPSFGNGFRDALAQQGLKPPSQSLDRGFDRALRRFEARRHGSVSDR